MNVLPQPQFRSARVHRGVATDVMTVRARAEQRDRRREARDAKCGTRMKTFNLCEMEWGHGVEWRKFVPLCKLCSAVEEARTYFSLFMHEHDSLCTQLSMK